MLHWAWNTVALIKVYINYLDQIVDDVLYQFRSKVQQSSTCSQKSFRSQPHYKGRALILGFDVISYLLHNVICLHALCEKVEKFALRVDQVEDDGVVD